MPGISSLVNFPGPVVHSDAIASERAAFTLEELTTLLERAGLDDLKHLRSRPLGEHQVHWAPGHGQSDPGAGLWHDVPLPRGTRLLALAEMRAFPRRLTRA
jgi:hypothetical protein